MRTRTSVLALIALAGAPTACAHSHGGAWGESATVHLSTLRAPAHEAHSTRVEVLAAGQKRWKRVTGRSATVPAGVSRFRFVGEYRSERRPTHHHHFHGCTHHAVGSGVGGAVAGLVGGLVVGAAIAASEHDARPRVVDRCVAEIDVTAGAAERVELTFRHSGAKTCSVQCWRDTSGGPIGCDAPMLGDRRPTPQTRSSTARFIQRSD